MPPCSTQQIFRPALHLDRARSTDEQDEERTGCRWFFHKEIENGRRVLVASKIGHVAEYVLFLGPEEVVEGQRNLGDTPMPSRSIACYCTRGAADRTRLCPLQNTKRQCDNRNIGHDVAVRSDYTDAVGRCAHANCTASPDRISRTIRFGERCSTRSALSVAVNFVPLVHPRSDSLGSRCQVIQASMVVHFQLLLRR